MANYQLSATDSITRTADMACIPPDPANRDYAEYLAWVEAGGVPDPYVAPPPPPPSVNDQQQTAVLFNHENRLRAAAGDPPLTLGDFIAKANSL